MARIDPTRLRRATQNSQSQNQAGGNLYANYEREPIDIANQRRQKQPREEFKQNVSVRREEGMFYKLRKLMYGPDILPDIEDFAKSRLSQGQQHKIKRYEEYYRRIQSTIN